MYLTALMQVTRLGCEILRSKERPTNPLMNNISSPLMKLKLPFKKGENEILTFDLMFTFSHLEQVFNIAENTKRGKNHI